MPSRKTYILVTLIATITLSSSISIYALSGVVEVLPTTSDVAGFRFSIKTKRITEGEIEFRVKIQEQTAPFSKAPNLSLGTINETDHSVSISPNRELEFSQENRTIETTFIAPMTTVNNRQTCFIFTNNSDLMNSGKIERMPSGSHYIVRLIRYAPKQARWTNYILIPFALALLYFGSKSLRSKRKQHKPNQGVDFTH